MIDLKTFNSISDKLNANLIYFLNKKNVYEKFVYNFKTNPHDDNPSSLMNSFIWRETNEGDNFWRVIHKEYEEFVDKIFN